jgi:altronate hydrolase
MKRLIKIHPQDNVAIALIDLAAGEKINCENEEVFIETDVPAKHKICLSPLYPGDKIIMYGILVGEAIYPIAAGGLLTTKNIQHKITPTTGKKKDIAWTPPDISKWKERTFMGYHRADGQVGTANVWLFFPLVFCENRNIEKLKVIFEKELYPENLTEQQQLLRNLIHGKSTSEFSDPVKKSVFPEVQVKFITHQGGCGGIRQDAETLAQLLAGYVNNPNVAGATVLSLGCQHLQIEIFRKALQRINPNSEKPVLIFEQQKLGTVDEMLNVVIADSFKAIEVANNTSRKPAPLSKIRLGLECGGSDGFSGISANPVLGYVSDLLAALGGTPILSEFPELCGVEQELADRCVDESKAKKFLELMNSYERAAASAGSGFDMNPSPGNIKDGLITDAMKSAGAAKKGGTSPITDVLDYGEYVAQPGLNLLCTPGNDVESTTGLVGSGANIVVFTTGLGTPTGNPIAPVVKISSNSSLAARMPDIIDLDTGPVITGERSIEEVGEDLLEYIIDVASGEISAKADILGQDDFIPWKRGVSL